MRSPSILWGAFSSIQLSKPILSCSMLFSMRSATVLYGKYENTPQSASRVAARWGNFIKKKQKKTDNHLIRTALYGNETSATGRAFVLLSIE